MNVYLLLYTFLAEVLFSIYKRNEDFIGIYEEIPFVSRFVGYYTSYYSDYGRSVGCIHYFLKFMPLFIYVY